MYHLFAPTMKRRYRHLKVPLYISKVGLVGIHYPSLVSLFSFKQTRASWSEDMDYIEKNVHVRKFPLSLSEREGFEREFQERGRGSFKRERETV